MVEEVPRVNSTPSGRPSPSLSRSVLARNSGAEMGVGSPLAAVTSKPWAIRPLSGSNMA